MAQTSRCLHDWLLFSSTIMHLTCSTNGKYIHQLGLHPIAYLEHERSLTSLNASELPRHWFHPKSNAIYATLPKDGEFAENDEVRQDFHHHRHLSRWERMYRLENSIDLDLNWNKTYYHRDLQEAQSLHGGRFNNYAAAPLSQGYGTHYAHIWVGSPKPQRTSVIVDTGSHFTAFPCKGCENCGAEHHTDPFFDPDLSQSFRHLSCNECELGALCSDGKCVFSQSYTEGSSWEANQVEDLVYLGGRDMLSMADPRNTNFAINFMFGCQTSENGLFVTQLADGIMGMSAHQYTITKQMYDKGKVDHNMFAMCFRRELGTSKNGVSAGVMTLGGIDNRLDSSPMVYAKNMVNNGWFTVYVKNVFIRAGGGQHATSAVEDGQHVLKIPLDLAAVNSGKGVIVDSGTTDTYLHKKLAKSFSAVWKTVTKKDYNHNGFLLTDEQLRTLPTILVQMRAYGGSFGAPTHTVGFAGTLDPSAPYDVLLAIPATNYMEYSPITGLYTSRLYFTESQGGVLGANAMQGHNVVFDWEHGRVGFSESTCEYEDEHSSAKIRGVDSTARFGMDCVLREPVLSRSCVETVDEKSCSDGIGEYLLGTETWTWSVADFGSDSGMSCQDVLLLGTPHQGSNPPKIDCGFGLCTEYRPCQIDCSQVPKATSLLLETAGAPCPSFWSACHESCIQTLFSSARKSDGICHVVSHNSRECHFGDCGKDDPCKVPYLVHGILGFRGANKEYWTAHVTEKMVQSVLKSVAVAGKFGTAPFSSGDVNILMISPWHDEVERNGSPAEEIGVKVVLQISFFNAKAEIVGSGKEITSRNHTRRKISATTKGLPQMFGLVKASSTCIESDLSPLATNALTVQEAIQAHNFMPGLIEEIRLADRGHQLDTPSPFAALFNSKELIAQSRTISVWTIRTEVEESSARRKGLLDHTPLSRFSVSARTLWLIFACFSILLLYVIDRFSPQSQTSDDSKQEDSDDDLRSLKSSTSCSFRNDDEESVALLRQLFPGGNPENPRYFDESISTTSSTLVGERFIGSSRGSRTSHTSSSVGIELTSTTSSLKSRSSKSWRRRLK